MAERLYYSDSFLTRFSARVVDIRELSRTDGQSIWQVALDRTAFYPTSGGQPFDLGTLHAVSRSGAVLQVPVEAVEEDGHGEIWHHTLKPLLAGTEVSGEIDWTRRLDHIQQHSGQHLLSAAFAREAAATTVSFHLGETVSTIDLAVDVLDASTVQRVERIANTWIAEDRPVTVRSVTLEEAQSLLAAGEVRKLPARDGAIRMIEIEGYDLNACGGTHVRSTGQIGGLLIRGVEKVRQRLRVEYVCGLRAVAAARQDFETLTHAASLLSTGRAEVPAGIDRLLNETKSAAKERQKLRTELAGYHVARLAVEDQVEHHLRLVRRVFSDRDTDYAKLLASQLIATVPQTVALLASTAQEPAFVVLARSSDLNLHAGNLLRESLASFGQRGGGSAEIAQGQIAKEQLNALLDAVSTSVRSALAVPAK